MIDYYSLFDKKVGAYLRPSAAKSVIDVQRQIAIMMREKDSSLALYPGEFAVYRVGKFDETEGKFTHMDTPEHMFEVASLLKEPSNG